MPIMFLTFNNRTVGVAESLMTSNDGLVLSSGVNDALDLDTLRSWYSNTTARHVYIRTGGILNLIDVHDAFADTGVEGYIYVYEPTVTECPEFTWSWQGTRKRLDAAARYVGENKLWWKPTGRALLEPGKAEYDWDYMYIPHVVPQMQTWIRQGQFPIALAKLMSQRRQGQPAPVPQLTVSKVLFNSSSVDENLRAIEAMKYAGVESFMVQWGHAEDEMIRELTTRTRSLGL